LDSISREQLRRQFIHSEDDNDEEDLWDQLYDYDYDEDQKIEQMNINYGNN
jgi:hypothetical protein